MDIGNIWKLITTLHLQRCDAAKPSCNQCIRAKKADPCEYDQGKPKSRVKILEAKIGELPFSSSCSEGFAELSAQRHWRAKFRIRLPRYLGILHRNLTAFNNPPKLPLQISFLKGLVT
jgi:hypothetical protein